MSLQFNDILVDCSYALIEQFVDTTLGTAVSAGSHIVTPPSMNAIYLGAILIVDTGASQEVVTVTGLTPSTFTATFANAHSASAALYAATFPSGQTDAPLLTQAEMIAYLNEVQNDFLLKVRPVYDVTNKNATLSTRFYPQPPNCIRLERIACNPSPGITVMMDVYETSQRDLDMYNPLWADTHAQPGPPQAWFRDEANTAQFGISPLPSGTFALELWYSICNSVTGNTLATLLLVPDVFRHAMKYGVLARAWSKDGELRDPNRATYCKKRYDLVVLVARKFMDGLGLHFRQESLGTIDFSPMPVGRGAAK
jgi:hypothetical protein